MDITEIHGMYQRYPVPYTLKLSYADD